ncbi:MAG: TRAP transporter large permease subunit [Enterocloster clostridioformis]
MVAGLLMTVILMATVGVTSRLRGFKPARESKADFHDIIHSLKDTIWALIFPILLLVGIRFGLFTPSEVGSFACVYALIVGFFIYKKLNFKRLIET